MCGLGKRSRHTNLRRAMNIDNISTVIGDYAKSVFKRVCSKSSPIKNLCFHLLSDYMGSGITVPGTIVDRILKLGLSPIDVLSTKSMTDILLFLMMI